MVTLFLGEMSTSNTGAGKVQHELGTFCSARKKENTQRMMGQNDTEANLKGFPLAKHRTVQASK